MESQNEATAAEIESQDEEAAAEIENQNEGGENDGISEDAIEVQDEANEE